MLKAFLSHSSANKNSYVEIVANRLDENEVVYDGWDFEAGLSPLEEILNSLDNTQLFVIFLSDEALESEWVKRELQEAKIKLDENNIKKIYPIIIDRNITHKDSRIPKWLKDNYNLRLINKPTIAARRIRQRLRELSWRIHQTYIFRETIFVGRHEYLQQIEQRLDDFERPRPISISASGFQGIGRRTFLINAIKKANIVKQSFQPAIVHLERDDSIEDFIIKLIDLGISRYEELPLNLLDTSIVEKKELATNIIKDIQDAREVVLVVDNGCLVNYTQDIIQWLKDILKQQILKNTPTILIASRFRVKPSEFKHNELFGVVLPELSVTERKGLLSRIIEKEDLSISTSDFNFFADLQRGFPEQVYYTVQLIKDLGVRGAKNETRQITDYNSERAGLLIERYEDQDDILEFIYLLSQFEYISLDFLFKIVDETYFSNIIDDLIAHCICDFIGGEREIIRLNDTIRDYIQRNRLDISSHYKELLKKQLDSEIQSFNAEEIDVSKYLYIAKEALREDKDIDHRYLIPSHFLKSMRELYYERRHLKRVVDLADKLLEKANTLDNKVVLDVRHFLCLSLARLRNKRFLNEVQHIPSPDHNFLIGFYYRLTGRPSDAYDRLYPIIDQPYVGKQAKRELVQVLISMESYDEALLLSKQNYEENPDNQYHIQAYFQCLIHSKPNTSNAETLLKLIDQLERVGSFLSQEMSLIAQAQLSAFIYYNEDKALSKIEEAVFKFPHHHQPVLAMFDISLFFRRSDKLQLAIERCRKLQQESDLSRVILFRNEALYNAFLGYTTTAYDIVNREIHQATFKKRLLDKIELISSQ